MPQLYEEEIFKKIKSQIFSYNPIYVIVTNYNRITTKVLKRFMNYCCVDNFGYISYLIDRKVINGDFTIQYKI